MTIRPDFAEEIRRNRRATWMLLFAFFVLLALVAVTVSYLIGGGVVGVVFGIVASAVLAFTSYRSSASLALRSSGAVPASPTEHARLHNVVESMAIAAGIPKPQVYVVDDPAPNAFATGRDPDHAAVAATTGLLAKMDRDELMGVMAHEMAHVRNYDIRVMTVAVATAGSIAIITDIFWRMMLFGGLRRSGRDRDQNPIALVGLIVVAVLAPIAAAMLKAAVSRSRESLADATAVELTRNPTGLRKALEKLDADSSVVRRTSHATSHLWIESPDDHAPGHRGRRFNDMFDTHPPLSERIDLLRAMEGLPAYQGPDAAVVAELAHAAPERPSRQVRRRPQGAATATAFDSVHLERAGTTAGASAPAGWYQDPDDPAQLRFWDGRGWTKHIHRG